MNPKPEFQPISFSWVAIHPQPKGVVQFIGGAFFGSFPTFFYPYFLQKIYDLGYTIVAIPFRFSFQHWSIAIQLFEEQEKIRQELLTTTSRTHSSYQTYQDPRNFCWIGHSLGCKYIALLEFISGDLWPLIMDTCVASGSADRLAAAIGNIALQNASILNQPSILLAPDISDTDSAIPPILARVVDRLGWGVKPSRKQTQCFIESSKLFNITRLISFDRDTVAGNQSDLNKLEKDREKSDIAWFIRYLDSKSKSPNDSPKPYKEVPGKHLEPIGIKNGNYIVDLNPLDKFIEPISLRKLEETVATFLTELNP
jgi:hypothetical protein